MNEEILGFIESNNAEMSVSEVEFLFSLIDQKQPKKVVEVGVAAGGTTAAILQYVSMKQYEIEMISIDKSELYYRDESLKTGYVARDYLVDKMQVNHKFMLGKYAVEYLCEIGNNIDFLILDTVHSMPGEFLDFLAFLPYLTDGAVVVLHDTCLNHASNNLYGYATQLLLDAVSGDKIFDLTVDNGIPNIGAFIVTNETRKNIEDVFRALLVTWRYDLTEIEVTLYKNHYFLHYPQNLVDLFDLACMLNKKSLTNAGNRQRNKLLLAMQFTISLKGKKIFLYGAGVWGQKIYGVLNELGIEVGGFIVTEKCSNTDSAISIYDYMKNQAENDLIVISASNEKTDEIIKIMKDNGICNYVKIPEMIYECI